jgi:hypothetical protein
MLFLTGVALIVLYWLLGEFFARVGEQSIGKNNE